MPSLVRKDAAAVSTDDAAYKRSTAASRTHSAAAPTPTAVDRIPAASPRSHRLFVGGCPTDLSASQLRDELKRRFQSFGSVSRVDVIEGAEGFLKGFAYVDIDSGRIPALLATFRGSQWRGQRFRVEAAKQDYITRLKQQWDDDQRTQRLMTAAPQHSNACITSSPPIDWSKYQFCFRVRPGLRIRVQPRVPCTSFPHVAALPITALQEEVGEERKSDEDSEGGQEGGTQRQLEQMRERLSRWKEEVEKRWVVHEEKKPRQEEKDAKRVMTSRADVRMRRQRERTESHGVDRSEEKNDRIEIESEEELATVDFLSDDESVTKEDAGLSAEELQRRDEEAEWAALEESGGEPEEEGDLQRKGQHEGETQLFMDGKQQSESSAAGEDLITEWAQLERGERGNSTEDGVEEDNREEDIIASTLHKQGKPVPLFPKKSVMEWWHDDDEGEQHDSAAASGEVAMSSLSSALMSSRSEFDIRPAYEGSSGQQLLELKRRYGGDARFALDDRFAVAAKQQREEKEEEERQEVEGEEEREAGVLNDAAVRLQLHAETLRSLQVLDEIVPGPSKFHMTLPRFSSALPAERGGGAGGAAVADDEKDAMTVEAELNAEQAKQSVLMWRQIQRFDPEQHQNVRGQSSGKQPQIQPQQKKPEREKRKREKEEETQSRDSKHNKPERERREAAVVKAQGETETEATPANQLYEVTVPRLRDLITDPSTVVQFSFAFDTTHGDTGDESVQTNVVSSFPTVPAPPSLPPLVTAPVGISASGAAAQSKARLALTRHQAVPRPSAALAISSSTPASAANAPDRAVRLSDLLALTQQAHSSNTSTQPAADTKQERDDDDDDDDNDGDVFIRGDDAAVVEAAWRANRAALRADYRKKSRDAKKKEANKEAPPAAWKAKRRASESGGGGGSGRDSVAKPGNG